MTRFLAIDTASAAIALALTGEPGDVESRSFAAGYDHSRLLLPAIESLLNGTMDDLGGIAVVRGPGSYAGLRVGIATAQGLALALGIPIRGVPTMEAVAAAAQMSEGLLIHPAGRGEFAIQRCAKGHPTGACTAAAREAIPADGSVVGEGAAELGGIEVTAERRCRAALGLALSTLRAGSAGDAVDAIYLREPNITISRRPPTLSR